MRKMRRDKPHYPPHWKEFSHSIRFARAKGRCECEGTCGLHTTHPGPRRCVEVNSQPAQYARGTIMLTVAHLCACDPPCVDSSHVKAMCKRCHLRVDRKLHMQHAAETRRRAREQDGQLTFLGGEGEYAAPASLQAAPSPASAV